MNKPADKPVQRLRVLLFLVFSLVTFRLNLKPYAKEMEAETVDYVEWKSGRRVRAQMLSICRLQAKRYAFVVYLPSGACKNRLC